MRKMMRKDGGGGRNNGRNTIFLLQRGEGNFNEFLTIYMRIHTCICRCRTNS